MNSVFSIGLTLLRRITADALLRRLVAAMSRGGRSKVPASDGTRDGPASTASRVAPVETSNERR